MPPLKKAAQAPTKGFSLGDLAAYSSGGGLPEGDYCLSEFNVQMYQAQNQQTKVNLGPPRLGVMITLVPLAGGEERTQFYSMGSNADKSWAPNPETGKGIVPVPGGPGTPPNASTNWAIFVKSLYDAGLPQGILDDDLSVLDGLWAHMANIPEPEERKGFQQTRTGEAAGEEIKGNKTIAVVTEIKDDGKPWEGGGGVPEVTEPAAKTAKVTQIAKKPATKAAAVPVEVAEVEESNTESVAIAAIDAALQAKPTGMSKLMLRTIVFKSVNAEHGPDMANGVTEEYFKTDAALNAILEGFGYKLVGGNVVKA